MERERRSLEESKNQENDDDWKRGLKKILEKLYKRRFEDFVRIKKKLKNEDLKNRTITKEQ